MGETNNPAGDVKTQAGEKGKTPKQNQTLTLEQENLLARANAALTNSGRLEAELRRSQNVANAALSQLKEIKEAQLKQEEAEAKDDPDKYAAFQKRVQAIRKEAEAEERLRKAEEKEAEIQTHIQEIRENRAERLAEKYNVEASLILKYGGDSKESMEELAKSYGERKAGEVQTKAKNESQTTQTRVTGSVDSGKTMGGTGELTLEEVKKMSPQEQHARQAEIAKMGFGAS